MRRRAYTLTRSAAAMLKDLQSIFKNTWDSFRRELGRREPEDEVAELLGMMRREMVDARALLPELDEEIARVQREIEVERRALADAQRRGSLAERIADAETVRVANEFAGRHAERLRVLEQKLEAARAERELRGREVEEMSSRYKQADTQRFALLAELRRARANERLHGTAAGANNPFDAFSRMAEKVQGESAYADALEDLADLDAPPASGSARPDGSENDVEEKLREMKRRMGKE
ncbi:MAG: hypothetical protein H0W11_12135 [Gemmatimonadetes bacterium]|nr:hypothetical protein [Gemmatimonadota bacterium]